MTLMCFGRHRLILVLSKAEHRPRPIASGRHSTKTRVRRPWRPCLVRILQVLVRILQVFDDRRTDLFGRIRRYLPRRQGQHQRNCQGDRDPSADSTSKQMILHSLPLSGCRHEICLAGVHWIGGQECTTSRTWGTDGCVEPWGSCLLGAGVDAEDLRHLLAAAQVW